MIPGDILLNPIQLADPDIVSNFDVDQKLARDTRRAFITNHTDPGALILGTHFTTPSVGHIVSDGTAWRFVAVDEPQAARR